MKRAPALLILVGVLLAIPAFAQPVPQNPPLPAPLPLFPPDNWWNLDISAAPVDGQNLNYIALVSAIPMHPDFGGDAVPAPATYGMTYVEVPGTEPLSTVLFDYASQSDDGALGRPPGYPIPPEAITQPHWIEGGLPGNSGINGDQHMLILDTDHRILFETWLTRYNVDHWEAGSGAIFYLDSNQRRPDTWTSADAAGLAILPGLVRYDEAYGTAPIQHAIRVTLGGVCGYVFPASHLADTGCGPPQDWPPLGARLRLKSTYTPPGGCTECTDPGFLRVVQAMKTYGLIVADTGSSLYISGTYDTRWDNGILNPAFGTIHGSDFEVIQTGWNPQPPIAGTQLHYYTIAPCRVVDTRRPPGAYGAPAVPGGGQRSFTITDPAGACGVPAAAVAVSVNVTVVNPPAVGDMRFWPANQPVPANSTINFRAGRTRANNAILSLSSSGSGALAVQNDMTSGAANLTIDVNGYFQ